ncbi:PREDICTED: NADH dehydrogenase [ubiquinone] 1 alpha subcomplex subunit 10, mitochondrial [Papilio xuthus]|uniref:NADH dehydrogenase [ubiquinone] 1 alpha subcomplex subunit 10, mitochondrial n=1 Tax=Papilio xuthus TaxID=66420 RepID=I4DJN1_PAPXU|nr:NADH dehydrogenase [ubiquinone] 1 alpha subcomplex subunit 10, mitochondrial [Papilio xuthus]XP_013181867.1 PREDICTED: NADH dehydrogenase [ubiquinone] 1 alpha subcomplex subunit 10, mitochondrial [Papilio xuthus]KPJ04189.1 NADH dehydrogenase [ubiquinone] 1 alpha subcomplex subunit 10, mitochondrial [Papilio xuthus]BAM18121.1 NADH:ubiquinone reductase 42kD subunit precursor [Papilio xuthus]
MATLVRTTFVKVLTPAQGAKIAACGFVQHRSIMGKALRESLPPPPPKPAPFDYENKFYTWFRSLRDRTTHRMDENSKVVVVEGTVASKKTAFAKCLAEDLGMKHFPEANMDFHYIRPNGVDLRTFDCQIPEDARTFDHVNFNRNPTHRHTGNFQIMMYTARYSQYIDALAHLLNTGQGVVLERSPYSDFVFLEAMYSQKYISKGVRSVYYELRNSTIEELMRPHLVIYLDVPVPKVMEAIKCRNLDHEVNGKAMTAAYLTEVERQYKTKYLRDISTHAELLVYDWTGGGEVEVVVEDIERLNFDKYTEREEPKMKDWRLPREVEWADQRMLYTNQKDYLLNLLAIPRLDVPELITSAEDAYEREKVIYGHPDFQHLYGYNKKDGAVLTKSKMPKYYEYV